MNSTIINTQGAEATDFDATLQASNLNFDVASDTVGGMDTGIQMPNRKLLYRADTRQALGIVGSDYSPSDPREFLKSQFEFAEFIKGKVVRAGFIPDRSRAFAFVETEKITIPRNLRKKGDPLAVYIYSRDGWDGGTPRTSSLYIERLACTNGMTTRHLSASLWVSHTSGMATRYEPRWKTFMAEIAKAVDAVRKEFIQLASTNITNEQMKEFLLKLIPGENGRPAARREEIFGLFNTGAGNEGVTRWDAYNAVTEYTTHHATYRKTENTSAETNRFLGVLETNTLNRAALNLLLS